MENEQMVCLICGHIAKISDEYIYFSNNDGEDFPVCPECDGNNINGHPSYCEWGDLSENERMISRFSFGK